MTRELRGVPLRPAVGLRIGGKSAATGSGCARERGRARAGSMPNTVPPAAIICVRIIVSN
jgi:hypothetical protein